MLEKTSGAKAADCVKDVFQKMKVVKCGDDQAERIRLVSLKIDGLISVERTWTQKEVEGQDVFQVFQDALHREYKDSSRYFIYDCHYDCEESSKKEELVFVLWAPGSAKIADRMLYSSSKGALGPIIDGVKHNLQVNDPTDFDRECFLDKLGKDVISLEGQLCK
ncbi:non-muscle cofilin 1-like isoform X1 [Sebastes fasciatus]|uniref:non-muscle cofilin 1-like isoform X1 n=1 Tax=Sebastes fasciatus TaxID=394691 RepID=UPI003D9E9438